MSLTVSPGIMKAEHISYAAKVLADRINHFIQTKQVDAELIPPGVLGDIKRFQNVVEAGLLQARDNVLADNPPAAIHAYALSTKLLRNVGFIKSDASQDGFDQALQNHIEDFKILLYSHSLQNGEETKLTQLRDYFHALYEEGWNERSLDCFADDDDD
jgi:hypothetical protein